MEEYILPFIDWFYKHHNDEYYEFVTALEERTRKKKLGYKIKYKQPLINHKTPKKIKLRKKKRKKTKKKNNHVYHNTKGLRL